MPVIDERARGHRKEAGPADEARQILVFRLGSIRVGLPGRQVAGLLRMPALVTPPGAPPFIEGLLNYHGEILPVFNMRLRFRSEPVPVRASQVLIVVRRHAGNGAFRADSVDGIIDVDPASIRNAGELAAGMQNLAGVAALEDGLLLIYGLETFLSASEEEEMKRYLASLPGDSE